jgi:uncharacterized cupredoxin-like copper-binding protein
MNHSVDWLNRWKRYPSILCGVLAGFLWLVGLMTPVAAIAAQVPSGDLSQQPAIEAKVSLGNPENELKFVPDHLEFSSGKRYRLVLSNPSALKHYFTSKDFADNIWNQKVEAGKVEVKGAIHELELRPGAEAEWVFIPIKAGTYRLRCTIPGHAEAGMVGEIAVK